MKTIILTFMVALSANFAMASNQTTNANANLGKLVTQFTKSLSPDAFNSAWTSGGSKEFTKSVKGNNTANAVGGALTNLVQNYMVDAAFKSGWNMVKDKWIKDTKTANTISTVAGSMLTLENYINPSMFTKKWPVIQPYWKTTMQTLAS